MNGEMKSVFEIARDGVAWNYDSFDTRMSFQSSIIERDTTEKRTLNERINFGFCRLLCIAPIAKNFLICNQGLR